MFCKRRDVNHMLIEDPHIFFIIVKMMSLVCENVIGNKHMNSNSLLLKLVPNENCRYV
uniref:Uncharacterized protein n=1 Tax=Arion vulgaris TaxID=1028688 RepID=A0A0B6ZDG8_9EUPU